MTALTHVAGWTLVSFVWQGRSSAAVALALRIASRAAASTRYAIAFAGLAVMLLAPAITAWRLQSDDGLRRFGRLDTRTTAVVALPSVAGPQTGEVAGRTIAPRTAGGPSSPPSFAPNHGKRRPRNGRLQLARKMTACLSLDAFATSKHPRPERNVPAARSS